MIMDNREDKKIGILYYALTIILSVILGSCTKMGLFMSIGAGFVLSTCIMFAIVKIQEKLNKK